MPKRLLPNVGKLVPLAFLLLTLALTQGPAPCEEDGSIEERSAFVGTWTIHHVHENIVLHIQENRQVLAVMISGGTYSCRLTTWKPMENGILVEGFPRIRLWPGRRGDELRGGMDKIPEELTTEEWARFPATFFLKRATREGDEGNPALDNLPLPAGWEDPAPPGG